LRTARSSYIKGPLAEAPGGTEVGWLADKFGIGWMVSIDTAP
jgi:uncharacterized glyoxalase superfamily protein PhnB